MSVMTPKSPADVTGESPSSSMPTLQLEFCDEWTLIEPPGPFTIGREADLEIDDNPYLHRGFLSLRQDGYWWIDNVGNLLTATISDADGAMHAWLAPGASLPLLFSNTSVRFTAGPTSYCLGLHISDPAMALSGSLKLKHGTTTLQQVSLTDKQKATILTLAEPSLLNNERTPSNIPSSADAATRIGWKLTTFNRQLDTVCQKLAREGARGLHGEPGNLASSRRARLVEYALATRLVTAEDLPFIDQMREQAAP